jgi:hypothetical protein
MSKKTIKYKIITYQNGNGQKKYVVQQREPGLLKVWVDVYKDRQLAEFGSFQAASAFVAMMQGNPKKYQWEVVNEKIF